MTLVKPTATATSVFVHVAAGELTHLFIKLWVVAKSAKFYAKISPEKVEAEDAALVLTQKLNDIEAIAVSALAVQTNTGPPLLETEHDNPVGARTS